MTTVGAADVEAALRRIRPYIHRTPVLTSRSLDEIAGARLFLKIECLQRTGSFKARGATNAIRSLHPDQAARGVACHSSGNHGQALAWSARILDVPCTVVIPTDASKVKRKAIVDFGATVVGCEPTMQSRRDTVQRVLASTGATEIHPYDDDRVIAGQGTAVLELLEQVVEIDGGGLDAVVVPVGGGGLASGTSLGIQSRSPGTQVFGAEPAGADDAARSLQSGRRLEPGVPNTIADGLRSGLSDRTFAVIRSHLADIIVVTDHATIEAMRLCWERVKVTVEPSGAVPLAATLAGRIPGERIGVILTGGNVDLDQLAWTSG